MPGQSAQCTFGGFLLPPLPSPLTTVPAPGEDAEELPPWLDLTPKIWGWLPQGTGLGFLFYLHCQTQQNCTRAKHQILSCWSTDTSVGVHMNAQGCPHHPRTAKEPCWGGDPTAAAPWRLEGLCHGPRRAQKPHTTWMRSMAKPMWLPTFPFHPEHPDPRTMLCSASS